MVNILLLLPSDSAETHQTNMQLMQFLLKKNPMVHSCFWRWCDKKTAKSRMSMIVIALSSIECKLNLIWRHVRNQWQVVSWTLTHLKQQLSGHISDKPLSNSYFFVLRFKFSSFVTFFSCIDILVSSSISIFHVTSEINKNHDTDWESACCWMSHG